MPRIGESELAMARELISLAQQQGVDLASMYNSGTFIHDGRIIWFWQKNDVLHYSLQGKIGVLPQRYKASMSVYECFSGNVGRSRHTGKFEAGLRVSECMVD